MANVGGFTNIEIMNAIRAEASEQYQSRIPVATQANLLDTGNAILNAEILYNEFLRNLVDKIAFQYVHTWSLDNPLKEFKRGTIPFGRTVEEMYLDIAQAQAFNSEKSETELFKRVIPDLSVIYHTINRQDFYKTTVMYTMLQRAFYNETGLMQLVGTISNSLYNGDAYDEFQIMKQLMSSYFDKGLAFPVKLDAIVDESTAKKAVVAMRQMVNLLSLPSRMYNSIGVMRSVRPEDQVLFITPDVEAQIDVDVLAAAFNLSKADFLARRILVDNFGSNTNIVAILADREWILQWDTLMRTEEVYNQQGLYWNMFLHHQGIYSTSRFASCVMFTTSAVSVDSIEVTAAPVTKGQYADQKATVKAASGASGAYVPQTVKWEVTGGTKSGTYIDMGGRLFVSTDETASTLTVKATSTYDSSVVGTASVTVNSL